MSRFSIDFKLDSWVQIHPFQQFAFGFSAFSLFVSKLKRALKNLYNPHKYLGFKEKTPLVSKPLGFRFQWCLQMAGDEGFEPSQTESESVVLPLHKSPMDYFQQTVF